MGDMEITWLAAAIALGLLEAATSQLVSIWFSCGAVCALAACLLGMDVTVQCIVFVASSALILLCTRPFVRKLTKPTVFKTNTDSLIGKTAIVTRAPDEPGKCGEAKVDGKYWSISSIDGEPLDEGNCVTVEKIEGVSLIVKK